MMDCPAIKEGYLRCVGVFIPGICFRFNGHCFNIGCVGVGIRIVVSDFGIIGIAVLVVIFVGRIILGITDRAGRRDMGGDRYGNLG